MQELSESHVNLFSLCTTNGDPWKLCCSLFVAGYTLYAHMTFMRHLQKQRMMLQSNSIAISAFLYYQKLSRVSVYLTSVFPCWQLAYDTTINELPTSDCISVVPTLNLKLTGFAEDRLYITHISAKMFACLATKQKQCAWYTITLYFRPPPPKKNVMRYCLTLNQGAHAHKH